MGQLEDQARRIIDGNQFMTLATADGHGTPWVSPVWFAHIGHRDLIWVSRLHREHTRYVSDRPEISVVIFDSTQTPGDVEAVYATGPAEQTDDPVHLEAVLRRVHVPGPRRVDARACLRRLGLRLFHVLTDRIWVLDDHDDRLPVEL